MLLLELSADGMELADDGMELAADGMELAADGMELAAQHCPWCIGILIAWGQTGVGVGLVVPSSVVILLHLPPVASLPLGAPLDAP